MFRALRIAAGVAVCLACRFDCVAATAVYAVTRSGSLYRSTDSAKSWQQIALSGVTASTYNSAVAIDPQDPAKIYVALYDRVSGMPRKGRAYATSPVRTL